MTTKKSEEKTSIIEQGTENVGKIRDIIFGANMREYDERFATLDEQLNKEVKRLREETDKRMNKFEDFVKSELSKLADKLSTEKKERTEEDKSIGNDMVALEDRVTTAIGEVDAQLGHEAQEIRESLRAQVKELMDNLNKQSGSLRDSKVDRAGLADMFTELSMRLTGDLELPTSQKK